MGAGVSAAITTFFTAKTLGYVLLRTILVNVALGAIAKKLTKRATTEAPQLNVTVRGTTEYRRIVFGTIRDGGVFVFYGTSSSSVEFSNDLLWYVIVYAGHQISAIKDIWLDTRLIADADIDAGTGAVTGGDFAGKCWIWKYLGTGAQTANSDLDTAFTEWTSNHRLRGCAYVVVKMKRDDTVYQNGAPQDVTALLDGALLYDPRLDSTNGGSGSHRRDDPSTWAFSAIGGVPALQVRWYLSGGSVVNDQSTRMIMYGLREVDSRILDSYVAAAANICDEVLSGGNAPPSGSQPRYRCGAVFSCGETRREILESLLAAMAGTATSEHGQWRVFAGAYDTPVHTLTQDDLYSTIQVQDTSSHKDRYNAVSATFIDAANQYVEQTTIFRTDSAYETQDGGERITKLITLRGVTDQYQAQRLAEIELRKSRMMRTVKLVGAANLLRIAKYETVTLSHARWNWTNRVFRCIDRQFEFSEEAGRVTLTMQRDDSGVYTDMVTADYETGTSATDVFQSDGPDAPTSLTVQTFVHTIRITVGLPAFFAAGSVVEVWEHTASTPFSSATKIFETRSNVVVIQKRDETTRYYWARIRDQRGALSGTFPASTGTAGVASFVETGDIDANAATTITEATNAGPTNITTTYSGLTATVAMASGWEAVVTVSGRFVMNISAVAACELRGWISAAASAPASTDLIASNAGNSATNIKGSFALEKTFPFDGNTAIAYYLNLQPVFGAPANVGSSVDLYDLRLKVEVIKR